MKCTSIHNVSTVTFNQPEHIEQSGKLSPVSSAQPCYRRRSISTVASIVTSNGSQKRIVQPSKYLPRAGPRPFSPATYPLVMSEVRSSTDQPCIDGANGSTFCQPITPEYAPKPLPLEECGFGQPEKKKPQSSSFFSFGSHRAAADKEENEMYLCSRFSACSSSIGSKFFEPQTTVPPSIIISTPRRIRRLPLSNPNEVPHEVNLDTPRNTNGSTIESPETCSPETFERIRRWLADISTSSCSSRRNITQPGSLSS